MKIRLKAVTGSLAGLSMLLGLAIVIPSAANRTTVDEPAGEGLRISPAGTLLLDATTRQPAVGSLPVNFVRSPDHTGDDGRGRFLIAVNSGYGLQFNGTGNRGQQSLAAIDLNSKPAPLVVQNVYFASPQSANVGVVFSPIQNDDGTYSLYVSGGFENKIWIFRFVPESRTPIAPTSPGPNSVVEAPFIDVSGFATAAPSPRYNAERAPVYPTGLAISPDGNTLFVANNLADSLGIISDLRGTRRLDRVDLRRATNRDQFLYPYAVLVSPVAGPLQHMVQPPAIAADVPVKVYISCWNGASVAVFESGSLGGPVSYIPVGQHPTAMLLNAESSRLYVVNSDDDSVSVVDTASDKEIERINVRLTEKALPGNSPEGLSLSGNDLYVANARSNSLAVVKLSRRARGNSFSAGTKIREAEDERGQQAERSVVRGFIPTGQYPSAVAVIDHLVLVGNGKGTGVENSSLMVNNSGRTPNIPNDRFPVDSSRPQGGQYSVSLVVGNISVITTPDDVSLLQYTQQVMRNNGLLSSEPRKLFPGPSPIKHVIYVIKENRTYDQVFGDISQAGNGQPADGDPTLAIFGAGPAAQIPGGAAQNITPNHHALALRFGLFDRFFVNSEASPDGHNWCTAAFSTDYVDKAYRWEYSRRGRGYDYEGFNRLPNYDPLDKAPSLFGPSVGAEEIANFMKRFVPYLHGFRDVGEPATLYLWDAAARAGLTYRNYGEFVATLSETDVKAIRSNRAKLYPDISPTISAFATKSSLEGHFSSSFRNFDLNTPDAMTIESYRAAKESAGKISPLINSTQTDSRFRGSSRIGEWLAEFRGFVTDRQAGKPDRMPSLSIMRLSNDHTDGIKARRPTPQFFVADNDYALGTLAEAVSNSPFWKDTAIFVIEDDAQDGPDHVDSHRSVTLVISAYNLPGQLTHEFHTTVSLIRTIELLLGIDPMNQLDAAASPMYIFRSQPDLRPFHKQIPEVAFDNLVTPTIRDAASAYWVKRSAEQDMSHADMADPGILNQIIWYSVRREEPLATSRHLPIFDALRLGLVSDREELADRKVLLDKD